MDEIQNHINKLGYRAKDRVTGFSGVIDSVCFDAYGCIQFCIKPPISDDGKVPSGYWFDIVRLDIDDKGRVVDLPNFEKGYVAQGRKGAADKPTQRA